MYVPEIIKRIQPGGGNGFIGLHLFEKLLENGNRINLYIGGKCNTKHIISHYYFQ